MNAAGCAPIPWSRTVAAIALRTYNAPLTTHGAWNAAHFHNPQYDKLFNQYTAAIDLQTQRTIAGKIQRLLLEETPIVIPYWIDGLTATTKSVHGVSPTSISQLFLGRAYKT